MCQSVHKVRKRFSKVTTRESTIESQISTPYVLEKKALLKEKAALTKAVQFLKTGKEAWVNVAKVQKEFNEHIVSEGDVASSVYSVANEASNSARLMHTDVSAESGPEVPFVAISRKVKAYIGELRDIEKDFRDVETSFTEMVRYEKKVKKLQSKKKPSTEKVNRNMDKMSTSRSVHESKVETITEKMKSVRTRYSGVLEAALYAFWLGQSKYFGVVEKHTDSIRQKALDSEEMLLTSDV
ncbi:AH/BAR [Gracilaria domingensis]|nr:AH/BAR [Gracilaria domingensis]